MDLGTLFQQAPQATQVVASLALAGTVVLVVYGTRHCLTWRRESEALKAVGAQLVSLEDLRVKRHAELFDQGDEIRARIKEVTENTDGGSAARRLIDDLAAQVKPPYDPAVIGAGSSWPEVSRRYLVVRHRPLRLMRAAAGWVVLLGLAGTVLGFIEALPQMRDAFANAAQAQAAVNREETRLTEDGETPGESKPAVSAARNMIGVLGDLGGVFLATLTGVLGALILYITSAGFEHAFDRLGHEIQVFGRRWFLPLTQPPYTQLDQAVKSELGSYFQALSSQFSGLMQPVVEGLVKTLGEVVTMSQQFSGNIEKGRETLKTFHSAVETLGTSAEKAVKNLSEIIEPSQKFLEGIERLQREGQKSFAETVERMEKPATALAKSAGAVETEVQQMKGMTGTLITSVDQVNVTLTAYREDVGKLRHDLGEFSTTVGEQKQAVTALAEAMGNATAEQAPIEASLKDVQEQLPQIRSHLAALDSGLRPEAALATAMTALLGRLDQGLETRSEELITALGELGERLTPRLDTLHQELSANRVEAQTELRQFITQITTAQQTLDGHSTPSFEGLREELIANREQTATGQRQMLDQVTALGRLLESGAIRINLTGTEDLRESIGELRAGVADLQAAARSLRPELLRATAAPTASKGKKKSPATRTAGSESLLAEQIRVLQRMEDLTAMTSEALTRLEQKAAQQEGALGEIRQEMPRRRRSTTDWLRGFFQRSTTPTTSDDRKDGLS